MRSFDRVIIITNGHSLTRKSQPTKRIRSPCDLELKKNAQRSFFLISRWKYDTNMVPENLIIISPFFPPSIFLSMWRGPIGLPIVANWVAKMKKKSHDLFFPNKTYICILQSLMEQRSRWGYIRNWGSFCFHLSPRSWRFMHYIYWDPIFSQRMQSCL